MPKIVKHSDIPYDGAILRALRAQAGYQSSQFAAMLSDLSGMRVLGTHISGYENGSRFIPDWLILAASRIFKVDPMLFSEYAARQLKAEHIASPREARKFITYAARFADKRRRLYNAGLRISAA